MDEEEAKVEDAPVDPPSQQMTTPPTKKDDGTSLRDDDTPRNENGSDDNHNMVMPPTSANDTALKNEIVPRHSTESSPPSSSSSSSTSVEEESSVPRSEYATVGRHLRRRLHVGRRRKGMRQALQRLKRSGQGSSRLRLPSVSVPVLRTPVLKRTTTGGSTNTNQEGSTTSAPPSHRSTKSTGSLSLANNAVVQRVDHLRRLAFRRFIQSGLVWERLDESPRRATISKELMSSDEDDLEFDQTTVRGMDIVIPPEEIVRETTCSSLAIGGAEEEEAKQEESTLDIIGLAADGTSPLRAVPEVPANYDRVT